MIDGPLNILRLEGEIDNSRKTIYIFLGALKSNHVSECPDFVNSTNVAKYVLNELKDSLGDPIAKKITYDLFVESSPRKNNVGTNWQDTYSQQMNRLYYKLTESSKGKVLKQNKVPNVRVHYTDISNELYNNSTPMFTDSNINNIVQNAIYIKNNNIQLSRDEIKSEMSKISKEMTFFKELNDFILIESIDTKPLDFSIMEANIELNSNKIELSPEQMKAYVQRVIFKLKYKYNNRKIKDIMHDMVVTHSIHAVQTILNLFKKLQYRLYKLSDDLSSDSYYVETDDQYIKRINNTHKYYTNVIKISNKCRNLNNDISSLYVMRRFLDKSYITNAVLYTDYNIGIKTAVRLVSMFGFRITHLSENHANIDLNELNSIFRSSDPDDIGYINNFLFNKSTIQCSTITNLPRFFL